MEDDDFYGAECELDDHRLIDTDNDDNDDSTEDIYEREFREKEEEFEVGNNQDITSEEFRFWQSNKSYFINDHDLRNDTLNMRNRFAKKKSGENGENQPLYPPERKPPIFDFFTVLTAFIAAVILAYYTISSY